MYSFQKNGVNDFLLSAQRSRRSDIADRKRQQFQEFGEPRRSLVGSGADPQIFATIA
jgi:hypothetical protein